MQYRINNTTLQYETKGAMAFGANECLIDNAIDLTEGRTWSSAGFTIEKLFEEKLFEEFSATARSLLIQLWKEADLGIDDSFAIDQYHTEATTQALHLNAVDKTKLLPVQDFPINIKLLEERISTICKREVIVRNPFDNQSVFHFRVIRPNLADHNPLHRDVWLEDYDNCINLYIPIAGSNELSSLILFEGSHHWPESKVERTAQGAIINEVQFNVPAVTDIQVNQDPIRPNPTEGEVLIFSPYLIHGGAVNLNKNKTRISIEVRLWKK